MLVVSNSLKTYEQKDLILSSPKSFGNFQDEKLKQRLYLFVAARQKFYLRTASHLRSLLRSIDCELK